MKVATLKQGAKAGMHSGGLPKCDDELRRLVEVVSTQDFGKPFLHRCRFNPRLRTSGGRYLLSSHDLEFNPHYMKTAGYSVFIGTIRHELCHYHLHLAGRGYRHRDQDFKLLLEEVGGARYADTGHLRRSLPARYEYVCTACQRVYSRKRQLNIHRYVCGVCHGKLKLAATLIISG